MATLGDIRFRVTKRCPGIDPDLLDGFILDRYTAILDFLKWSRQRVDYVITTAAPYGQGTVSLVAGGVDVTLAGGAFTEDMTGRILRPAGREEYYEITVTSGATATLDRAFDGETGEYSYQVLQNIYPLPADARIIENIRLLDRPRPLGRKTRSEMARYAPNRGVTGTPAVWAPALDSATDPPVMQVELYPIPDKVSSAVVSYIMEAPSLGGSVTSLLPWLRPAALVAGATADALEALEKYAAADRQELKYKGYVADMARTEGFNRGAQPLRMSNWLTRHNLKRAMRGASNRTGPRMP